MKRKVYKNGGFSFAGAIMFFALIAAVIQIAILVYDYIIGWTNDKWLISVLILNLVFILATVCTVCDIIRRKIMVDRPVERILKATERIAAGDFTARVDITQVYSKYNEYDLIAENINTLAAELGKSEIMKNDFLSNVSHELKTPLAVIKGYAALLASEELDTPTRVKYSEVLLSATNRLSNLVTDILRLSKLENQSILPEREKISLDGMLAEVLVGYESLFEKKNITLECELDEITVTAPRSHLEIVFNNLISNAIKFTDGGGTVGVRLYDTSDGVVLEIRDTGCGISPEIGERIFEKFYQGDTSHSGEGNGLGLALVKRVIDSLGGNISVKSELGVGSVFKVTLRDIKI